MEVVECHATTPFSTRLPYGQAHAGTWRCAIVVTLTTNLCRNAYRVIWLVLCPLLLRRMSTQITTLSIHDRHPRRADWIVYEPWWERAV